MADNFEYLFLHFYHLYHKVSLFISFVHLPNRLLLDFFFYHGILKY